MSLTHSFSVTVARAVGERKAVILGNFSHWHQLNQEKADHVRDGFVWTYNSISAFEKVWPYLSQKEIRTALDSLERDGYLTTGNFNEWKIDRTKWYALTEKSCELIGIDFAPNPHLPKRANASDQTGKCILPEGQTDLPEQADGFAQEGEPIPLKNTIQNQYERPVESPREPLPKSSIVLPFGEAKPLLETHRAQLLSAAISKETDCKNLGISTGYYDHLVNAFFDKQIRDAERQEPLEYYRVKAHFDNWIRVQVKLGLESDYHPQHVDTRPVFTPSPLANRFAKQSFTPTAHVYNELN